MPDLFGLETRPFSAAPDPSFMVWAAPHKTISDDLIRATGTQPVVAVVTGDVGTGKTVLARALLNDPAIASSCLTVFLRDCAGSDRDLLAAIVAGLCPDMARSGAWDSVVTALETASRPHAAILIVLDEAQTLSPGAAQALARLADHVGGAGIRLHLWLFGQPGLTQALGADAMRDLRQAVTHRFHLTALPTDQTPVYIADRMRRAGATRPVFSDAAMQVIERACGGNPRRIGKLCDIVLFLAKGVEQIRIDDRFVLHVLQHNVSADSMVLVNPTMDLEMPVTLPVPDAPHAPAREPLGTVAPEAARRPSRGGWRPAALGLAVAAGLGVIAVLNRPDPPPPDPQVPAPAVLAVLPLPQKADQDGTADFARALAADTPQEAAIGFSLAALHGHARAAEYLGQLYATGDGTTFSPRLAARWYKIADMGSEPVSSDPSTAPSAVPLFARVTGQEVDLVWDGSGDSFLIEMAGANGQTIAQFDTPLTAARVVLPQGAQTWRVSARGASPSAWAAISNFPDRG